MTYDYTQDNLSVANSCPTCEAQDTTCDECLQVKEARLSNLAHELVDEGNLQYKKQWTSIQANPSASDWVGSQTITGKAGKVVKMIEIWNDQCHLVELSVKFIDNSEELNIRHEFLPPIAQLVDGGELGNLWELDDYTQSMRETQCPWCFILTPKQFNDCQDCDKPLERNVRA